MKNNTIYLEVTREKNSLKIGIRKKPDFSLEPSIDPYEIKDVSMETIGMVEKYCVETADFLNKEEKKGRDHSGISKRLKQMGDMLCDELLTSDIKEKLTNTDAEYLILRIDDRMVHIPWELIRLDHEFLCQRFNMGRLVKTRQKITESDHQTMSLPLNMWILANPSRDLPSADLEADRILQVTDAVNLKDSAIVNASLDSSDIMLDGIKSKIKNSDFVHFAGHADYSPQNSVQSGWKLADSTFTAHDIDKMAGSSKMPVLVFSNACQSARTEEWQPENDSFGMANAFLRAGVKYYIGSFWEIMDTPSSLFACEFYSHFFSGKTIGESVRQARLMLIKEYGHDFIGWTSYLLYGDPRFRCCDRRKTENDDKKQVKLESTVHDDIRTRSSSDTTTSHRLLSSQSNPKWIPIFLLIAVLVSAVILGYTYMTKDFELKNAKFKIMTTDKEKQRNDKLIDSINKTFSTPHYKTPSDNLNSAQFLTIAIVHDPFQPKASIVSSEIKNEIKDKYPNIKFVERQELNTLLEEANLALSLPSEDKLRLNILHSKLILKLKVDKSDIEVQLLDTKNMENIFHAAGKLENGKKMPRNIFENLLKTLESRS
ncbi:MAG: CHAT domain-containing protein [Desulfobacterales bacterium]|nr:CHAT domain-containing protein [Desulfobacterales bacterium]